MSRSKQPSSWQLFLGRDLIGTLTHTKSNQPWFNATFHPEPVFGSVRRIFDEEWELHRSLLKADELGVEMDTTQILRILDEISMLDLRLFNSDGSGEQKFHVIHIHGDSAEFTPYW